MLVSMALKPFAGTKRVTILGTNGTQLQGTKVLRMIFSFTKEATCSRRGIQIKVILDKQRIGFRNRFFSEMNGFGLT